VQGLSQDQIGYSLATMAGLMLLVPRLLSHDTDVTRKDEMPVLARPVGFALPNYFAGVATYLA